MFDQLTEAEQAQLDEYFEPREFSAGACILAQGGPGDGCYLIDSGTVRLELDIGEIESDCVLGYIEPGGLLGEFALFDHRPRSASAYAHTDVTARWLSQADFERICNEHPQIGVNLLANFSRSLTEKLRTMNERLATHIAPETPPASVQKMIARAAAAQQAMVDWPEDRIDALIQDIAQTIADEAEALAEATVRETRLGVVEHKVAKIRFASLGVVERLIGEHAAGLVHEADDHRVMEFASPMGVILGLIPLTNPVSTIVFKALIVVKSRNALILSVHRDAHGVGLRAAELIDSVLARHGAPPELVQVIRERSSRVKTAMFMMHEGISLILATGGPGMVRAAYSSGTPAIGVGAGNAPVWICADADVTAAAEKVVGSKSFDNGVICGSENNLVVDESVREAFVAALEAQGAAVLSEAEVQRLLAAAFKSDGAGIRRELVGQSAETIAKAAGIERDGPVRLLVAPVAASAVRGPMGSEKLAPIVSLFTVKGERAGLSLCRQILLHQGQGHTAIIHTRSDELAGRYGLEMPASRVLVNCGGSQGCVGMVNGLTPSFTLGCGTFGRGSTTDNVTYRHLLNIRRLAFSWS